MYFFYYMPVGIDTETRRFPVLTVFFSAACALVFVLHKYFRSSIPLDFGNLVFYPDISKPLAALTAAFLHFGYMHIIGNLVYLLLFGWYLEGRLGPAKYALLFLGAAFLGNMAQGWYNIHVLHLPSMGIIGASGAVSGILGAFLVRLYVARVRIAYWVFMPLQGYTRGGRVDVPVVFALALWVLLQVSRGLVQLQGAAVHVAYVTHIAGFSFGVAFAIATGGWQAARDEAHRIRAQRSLRRGDSWGAREELSHYLARNPEDGAAHLEMARILVQTDDAIGAQASYLMACELLLRANLRGAAEEAFQEALRGFPAFSLSAQPQLDMAFGLERNLKPETALAAYEGFCRRFPRDKEAPCALLRAANLHKKMQNGEQARGCYQKLVETYPDDDWVEFAREQARQLA